MFELCICSTYRLSVAHEFAFELTHGLCLSTICKSDGCFSLIPYPICLGCPLSISSLSCGLHKLSFRWQLFLFTGTEKFVSLYVEKWRKSGFLLISPISHSLCSTNQEHSKKKPNQASFVVCDFSWWMRIESGSAHAPSWERKANRFYLFEIELSEK